MSKKRSASKSSRVTRSVIDVSNWEDPIDFKKVAAGGIVAVIAKARWIVLSERDAKDIRRSR